MSEYPTLRDLKEGAANLIQEAFSLGEAASFSMATQGQGDTQQWSKYDLQALREIAQFAGWKLNASLPSAADADLLVEDVKRRMDAQIRFAAHLQGLAKVMGLPDSIWTGNWNDGVHAVLNAAETAVISGRSYVKELDALRGEIGKLRAENSSLARQVNAAVNRNKLLEEENGRLKRALETERHRGYQAALREIRKSAANAEKGALNGPSYLTEN